MRCKRCGSAAVQVQAVPVTKRRGCLTTLFYILLLLLPVVGWIALFLLIRGQKTKIKSMAVCQSCGRKWAL